MSAYNVKSRAYGAWIEVDGSEPCFISWREPFKYKVLGNNKSYYYYPNNGQNPFNFQKHGVIGSKVTHVAMRFGHSAYRSGEVTCGVEKNVEEKTPERWAILEAKKRIGLPPSANDSRAVLEIAEMIEKFQPELAPPVIPVDTLNLVRDIYSAIFPALSKDTQRGKSDYRKDFVRALEAAKKYMIADLSGE